MLALGHRAASLKTGPTWLQPSLAPGPRTSWGFSAVAPALLDLSSLPSGPGHSITGCPSLGECVCTGRPPGGLCHASHLGPGGDSREPWGRPWGCRGPSKLLRLVRTASMWCPPGVGAPGRPWVFGVISWCFLDVGLSLNTSKKWGQIGLGSPNPQPLDELSEGKRRRWSPF